MSKPLIIFTHGGGRLGNQLLNAAHFYSFWLEYQNEFDIMDIGFWAYYDLFEYTSKKPLCVFSSEKGKFYSYSLLNYLYNNLIGKNRRMLNQMLRLIHLVYTINYRAQSILKGEVPNYLKYLNGEVLQSFNLDSQASVDLLKKKKKTALAGWPFRCWGLFEKHQDAVRRNFQFSERYRNKAEEYITCQKNKYDKVVGVFIRRGDYKEWYDGEYYFEISFYRKIMEQIISEYRNARVGFVIASDELQDINDFEGMNACFTTGSVSMGGHFVESLAELSLCDLIISPPSTFGIWASFIGNKPILPLVDNKQNFSTGDVVNGNIFDAINHQHMVKSVK
jgi:Glycosyl transferase family 11.